MLYHSYFKYYAKAILNRKNDAWYFDKMVNAYEGKATKVDTKVIEWAQKMSAPDKDTTVPGFDIHPLYQQGLLLRNRCLQEFKNKHQAKALKVIIQVPSATFSPGGFSWFTSIAESLRHMGVEVIRFWDKLTPADLQNANLLFTSSSLDFTKKIDWTLVKSYKQLRVLSTCNILEKNSDAATLQVNALKQLGVDDFYCFYNYDYAVKSCFYEAASKKGSVLLSLEFAANPLYHYPAPFAKKTFDYIFLGSANWDKARRYYDYFYPVIKHFKGMIEGPGWPWSGNFYFNHQRDRWLYSRASVALNLHINSQIQEATELNERTYILAACGVTQVVDNPMLLSKYFTSVGYVSNDPSQYFDCVRHALDNREESLQLANSAMQEVFSKHTTFHRLNQFISEAVLIPKAKNCIF